MQSKRCFLHFRGVCSWYMDVRCLGNNDPSRFLLGASFVKNDILKKSIVFFFFL